MLSKEAKLCLRIGGVLLAVSLLPIAVLTLSEMLQISLPSRLEAAAFLMFYFTSVLTGLAGLFFLSVGSIACGVARSKSKNGSFPND